MVVILAGLKYYSDDPRWMSIRKIILIEAIISETIFRNRGNMPKVSTPPHVSRSRSRRRRTGVRKAKELHLD